MLMSPVSITLLPSTVLNEQLYQRKLGGSEGHVSAFEDEQLGNFYMVSFAFAEYIGQVFNLIHKHKDALIARYRTRTDEPLLKILSGLMVRADSAARHESEGVKFSAYKEEWLAHYKNYLLAKEYYLAALRGWLMVEGLEGYPGTHALMGFRKVHLAKELHSFEMKLLKEELNKSDFASTAASLKKQAMERILRKKYYYEACAALLIDIVDRKKSPYLKLEELRTNVRDLLAMNRPKVKTAVVKPTTIYFHRERTASFKDTTLMTRLQKKAKEQASATPAPKPLLEENKDKSKRGKRGGTGKGKGGGKGSMTTGSATLPVVRTGDATKDQNAALPPTTSTAMNLIGNAGGDERDGEEEAELHTITEAAASLESSLLRDALGTAEKDETQMHSFSASIGSEETAQINATEGGEEVIITQSEIIPAVASVGIAVIGSGESHSSDEGRWQVAGPNGKAKVVKGQAKCKERVTVVKTAQQPSATPRPYLAAAKDKVPVGIKASSVPKPSGVPASTVVTASATISHGAAVSPVMPLVVVEKGDGSASLESSSSPAVLASSLKDTVQLASASVSATVVSEVKPMVSAAAVSTEDAPSCEDEIDDVLSTDYWNIIDQLKTAGLLKEMGFSDLPSRLKDIESRCSKLSLPEQTQLLTAELESIAFRINFLDCVRGPSLETRAALYQNFFQGQKMNPAWMVVTPTLLDSEEKQFISGLQRARAGIQKERRQLVEWQQRLAAKLPA